MPSDVPQNDSEFEHFAQLLKTMPVGQFLDKLNSLSSWSASRLSELLVFLAHEGGTGWPTKLQQLGADVNFCADGGETALSQCVHGAMTDFGQPGNDTFPTALELISIGCDPNQLYMQSYSVTSLAITWKQIHLGTLFLLAGADTEREEPDGSGTLRQLIKRSDIDWAMRALAIKDRIYAGANYTKRV